MSSLPARESSPPAGTSSRPAGTASRPVRAWYVLLAIPFAALLYPPLYAHHDPELFGFPFFYWYQLAWVPVTALLTMLVYRRGRSR